MDSVLSFMRNVTGTKDEKPIEDERDVTYITDNIIGRFMWHFGAAAVSVCWFFSFVLFSHHRCDSPLLHPLTPFPFLAMGCPHASKDAAVCSEDALSAFFNTKHPGQYMIINLSEKQYDYSKFDDQV